MLHVVDQQWLQSNGFSKHVAIMQLSKLCYDPWKKLYILDLIRDANLKKTLEWDVVGTTNILLLTKRMLKSY